MQEHADINIAQRRLLLAAICVNESLLRRAMEVFYQKNLMRPVYPVGEFLLNIMTTYFTEFKAMPTTDILRGLILAELAGIDEVHPEDKQELDCVYDLAVSITKNAPERLDVVANHLLDKLLQQAVRLQVREKLVRPSDMMSTLSEARQQLQAGLAKGTDRFQDVFTKRRTKTRPGRYIQVGVPFFDYFVGGHGPASGDVIGHAAPRGGGKTTLSSQLACETAKREEMRARQEGRPPEWVYVFNYEQIIDPMSQMLTHLAEIDRDTVDKYVITSNADELSYGDNYKPYELEMFRDMIAAAKRGDAPWPMAERERVQQAEDFIRSHIMLADFSGQDEDNLNLAGSYVDGVRQYIDMHQEFIGRPGVAGVFIDYAGICVRIHIANNKRLKMEDQRHLIKDLPMRCKREIGNALGCFVFVSQQLSADEASRRPGTRPDPNKFNEGKAFAENCDFTLVNGVPGPGGLTVFVQSKGRRGDPRPDQVIQLHGRRGRWVAVDQQYVVINGEVTARQDAAMLQMGNLPPTIADTLRRETGQS